MIDSSNSTSTRPYLLRALYEWCCDNSLTPYIAAYVDGSVQVPMEYVKNNEIVLNISMEATSHLKLGNEFVEFHARFGGVAREILVPISHVIAIYARENGQGMAFPVPQAVLPQGHVTQPGKRKAALDKVAALSASGEGDTIILGEAISEPAKVVKLKSVKSVKPVKLDTQTDNSVDLPANTQDDESPEPPQPPEPPKPGRPSLTRIK